MENFDTPESRLEITDAMIVAKGLLMLEDALTFIQWVELPEKLKEPIQDIAIHTLELRKGISENSRLLIILKGLTGEIL